MKVVDVFISFKRRELLQNVLTLCFLLTHSQAQQPMQGLGPLKKSPPSISILGLAPPISDSLHPSSLHPSI